MEFDDMESAFDYIRERNSPQVVTVNGKRWKLYPSGRAEEVSASKIQEDWRGEWEVGKIGPMTVEEMRDEYSRTIKASLDYFGEALNEVYGVFLKGTNIKVCITGNSPNSPEIAEKIVADHNKSGDPNAQT